MAQPPAPPHDADPEPGANTGTDPADPATRR